MDPEIKALLLVILIIFPGLIAGTMAFESAQCDAKGKSFESVEWGIIQGCMVKHNGKWLPLENIRGFDDRD